MGFPEKTLYSETSVACVREGSCVFSYKAVLFAFIFVILAFSSLSFPRVKAIPESNMLDVPYHSQFESGDKNQNDFCAVASVQMVLQYISGQVIPQPTLAAELQTDQNYNGTLPDNVHIPFDNRNYTVNAAYHSTLDDLKSMNSMGYVSIINIWYDNDHKDGHYVVVTGYNTTGIFVNDPAWGGQPRSRPVSGENAFISNTVLNDLWTHHKQLMFELQYPKASNTVTDTSSFPVYNRTISIQSVAGTAYACYIYRIQGSFLAGHGIGVVMTATAPLDLYLLKDPDYRNWWGWGKGGGSCKVSPLGALIFQKGIQSYTSIAATGSIPSISQDQTLHFILINNGPTAANVAFTVYN